MGKRVDGTVVGYCPGEVDLNEWIVGWIASWPSIGSTDQRVFPRWI